MDSLYRPNIHIGNILYVDLLPTHLDIYKLADGPLLHIEHFDHMGHIVRMDPSIGY
jgi:hypothetical protein